jgi:pterin-4a-carbinolamine dehydratase
MRRPNGSLNENFDLPIRVKKESWEHLTNPRRIGKNYAFDNAQQIRYFISSIFEQLDIDRHPVKITIDDHDVSVELYTKIIDDVTEVDLEMARALDEIYEESSLIVS